jgi:hypothetical protein
VKTGIIKSRILVRLGWKELLIKNKGRKKWRVR